MSTQRKKARFRLVKSLTDGFWFLLDQEFPGHYFKGPSPNDVMLQAEASARGKIHKALFWEAINA